MQEEQLKLSGNSGWGVVVLVIGLYITILEDVYVVENNLIEIIMITF